MFHDLGYYHVFPFQEVEKGEQIIIWGMGEVGKQYVEQIKNTSYCRIGFCVDRGWANMPDYRGVDILPPDRIKGCNERIVIANGNNDIAQEIRHELQGYGIPDGKIIHNDLICENQVTFKGNKSSGQVEGNAIRIDYSDNNKSKGDMYAMYYHLFPFEKVKQGANILLYGAGEVGQWYVGQILRSGYAKVKGILDASWDKYPEMEVPIVAPEKWHEFFPDFIVVSIADQIIANDVARMLVDQYNVPEEKIILGCERFEESPIVLKPQPKSMPRLAYEPACIPVAVELKGGLGDCLIYKRKIDEIMGWDPRIVLDCYVTERMLPFMHSFFDGEYEGRINAIVLGDRSNFEAEWLEYAMAFQMTVGLQNVSYNHSRLLGAQYLLQRVKNLREQVESYGVVENSMYPLHYARCRKDGLNCYTSFNRYDGFAVDDFHTHVPMSKAAKEEFEAYGLGEKYITVNFGYELHGKDLVNKMWPLEYFEELVEILKIQYPHVKFVQVGSGGWPQIVGCDEYLMGTDLEETKYILQNAMFHIDIEGGLVHLASQLRTRCVVLFGPTPMHYYAYSNNLNISAGSCHDCCWYTQQYWECYRGMEQPECMFAITPRLVADRIIDNFEKLCMPNG